MRPILEVKNLSKTYGRQVVLDDLSFVINEGAHIGLVGRNGTGKTTLLRLIAGDEELDDGSIQLMPWTKLGVLRQHEVLPSDVSVLKFLAESHKPEWECAKLAAKFGLSTEDLAKAPTELSGGYQMRVKISRLLLDDPTLLLLDEPMNYLDLPTMLLLEVFLRNWRGTFVMTSHDRETMQRVCTSTIEVANGKISEFPGDLETFLAWKEEQEEFARRTNKRLRREITHTQEFVDRFRYKASLASQAQSKIKHIAKLRSQLRELGSASATAAFRIPCPTVTSGPAVRCQDLAIGYGEKIVADKIDLEIQRGDKVAIVGENGRGKSTLLKTLANKLEPLSGSVKWWHWADIGFFAQQSEEALHPDATVLQTLTSAAPAEASAERILAAAGAFLFHGDDLEKTCRVLSGGEKARLRLARMILEEHNVLILDEPTNHLDAETVEVLAAALKEYKGTVIFVSHARTFTNALADKIFEVRKGGVRHYTGTYEEYVSDLMAEAERIETQEIPEDVGVTEVSDRKEKARELRQTRRAQQRLEDKIKILESEKSKILAYFFENPTDYAPDKAKRLSELEEEIAGLERDWLRFEE